MDSVSKGSHLLKNHIKTTFVFDEVSSLLPDSYCLFLFLPWKDLSFSEKINLCGWISKLQPAWPAWRMWIRQESRNIWPPHERWMKYRLTISRLLVWADCFPFKQQTDDADDVCLFLDPKPFWFDLPCPFKFTSVPLAAVLYHAELTTNTAKKIEETVKKIIPFDSFPHFASLNMHLKTLNDVTIGDYNSSKWATVSSALYLWNINQSVMIIHLFNHLLWTSIKPNLLKSSNLSFFMHTLLSKNNEKHLSVTYLL